MTVSLGEDRHREKAVVTTEAETGEMLPQAQEPQGLWATSEAGRGTGFCYQSLQKEPVRTPP